MGGPPRGDASRPRGQRAPARPRRGPSSGRRTPAARRHRPDHGRRPEHSFAAILQSLHSRAQADVARGQADGRTHAQVVADLFVSRLTGQVTAQATPLQIDLVVSAETLLGDGDEPGELPGHGPIPAGVARKLARTSPDTATAVRRLFRFDDTDGLVALESTQRGFRGLLREFVTLRDQICRTPFCNSPIRHGDHVVGAVRDGPTSGANAQGLCLACNLTKEQPGWRHRVLSDFTVDPHVVEVTTPTGHRHRSAAPPVPRGQRWVEESPGHWVLAA